MYSFIGIWLLMARVKKLRIKEYWSRGVLLHFRDNSANLGDDSSFKIRKIIDTVRVAFRSAFNPYRKLCVDESLLLSKGRLSFKQYISSKRSIFGMKTFVLCDCKIAYVVDFIVYTGTTKEIEVHNLGKSGNIVATLMKPYLELGHTQYVDNWCTCPSLFLWLHNQRTAACGTVRRNRIDFPKLQKQLKQGEIEFMSIDAMLAIK
ncbi:piggyBac transposable element-derived protein 4-like [Schistocerca piceifrons]|uniref:piggyBac transposable element-derived protein 4-like n=1 Tax=Schistocerca piceifrons TaxID=274613 RepID=UPI001F5FEF20|nr:piggyBac transposable element-derived protein 4-like [Schistocerca piceifrons]